MCGGSIKHFDLHKTINLLQNKYYIALYEKVDHITNARIKHFFVKDSNFHEKFLPVMSSYADITDDDDTRQTIVVTNKFDDICGTIIISYFSHFGMYYVHSPTYLSDDCFKKMFDYLLQNLEIFWFEIHNTESNKDELMTMITPYITNNQMAYYIDEKVDPNRCNVIKIINSSSYDTIQLHKDLVKSTIQQNLDHLNPFLNNTINI